MGILWGSFWMYGWEVLNVWVLILGNLTSSEDLKGKTRTKTITRSAELECSRLKILKKLHYTNTIVTESLIEVGGKFVFQGCAITNPYFPSVKKIQIPANSKRSGEN